MKQRPSKIRSLYAVGAWTWSEINKNRGRRIDKQFISKKRRALEKKDAEREIEDSVTNGCK